jgi:hypothetical protein
MKKPPSKRIRPSVPTFGMGANITQKSNRPAGLVNSQSKLQKATILPKVLQPTITRTPQPKKTDWNNHYTIRYVVVDPQDIINMCGPDYNYIPRGWSEKEIQKQKEQEKRFIEYFNKEINFFNNLEKSILEKGILNPVLLTSGLPQFRNIEHMAPEQQKIPAKDMLVCELLGGSRIYVAKKLNMFVPAIICDFTGAFQNYPQLFTEVDIRSYFNNPPEFIQITDKGVRMDAPDQIHISEKEKNVIPELRRNFLHGHRK